jgi:phosphoribosylanthranilate isomerase
MSLRTTVKVSHISNLSDARYCSGMGVEMLGFRVIPGADHYMPPHLFQDIRGWLAGPSIVAELCGVTSEEQIREAVQTYAPDYFEVTAVEYKKFKQALQLPCIIHFSDVGEIKSLQGEINFSHALADANIRCDDIASLSVPVLITVASLEETHEKLSGKCFKGIVLEGPKEQRPGVTNYDQLGTILEALENED